MAATSQQKANYRRRCRQRLAAWRSGPCERCGTLKVRREMAHIGSTPLSGRSRGQQNRYHDLYRHPQNYARLCLKCHGKLDAWVFGNVETRAQIGLGYAPWGPAHPEMGRWEGVRWITTKHP